MSNSAIFMSICIPVPIPVSIFVSTVVSSVILAFVSSGSSICAVVLMSGFSSFSSFSATPQIVPSFVSTIIPSSVPQDIPGSIPQLVSGSISTVASPPISTPSPDFIATAVPSSVSTPVFPSVPTGTPASVTSVATPSSVSMTIPPSMSASASASVTSMFPNQSSSMVANQSTSTTANQKTFAIINQSCFVSTNQSSSVTTYHRTSVSTNQSRSISINQRTFATANQKTFTTASQSTSATTNYSRSKKFPFAAYVHVPFCLQRCGYCDFNTYTARFGQGAEPATFEQTLLQEIEFAAKKIWALGHELSTLRSIFFGGGTPSLLTVKQLEKIIEALEYNFGIAKNAEITLEANPDTVTPETIAGFARAGFTRLSMGMQSAVPRVLTTLDRTHSQAAVSQAIQAAKDNGLQTSVDLIYGTPGETLLDWQNSLKAAIDLDPSHISAYSLIIEEGTKMARQIRSGQLPDIDPDQQAEKYVLATQILEDAQYYWYEISNFAKANKKELAKPVDEWQFASKHNLAYWHNWQWWGFGPGAHSHLGQERWWNAKHPLAYKQKLGTVCSCRPWWMIISCP